MMTGPCQSWYIGVNAIAWGLNSPKIKNFFILYLFDSEILNNITYSLTGLSDGLVSG